MRAPPRRSAAAQRLLAYRSLAWLPLWCAAALPVAALAQPFPAADAAAPHAPVAPLSAPAWPGGSVGVETGSTDWRAAHQEVNHAAGGQPHTAHTAAPAAPVQPAPRPQHGEGHEHEHEHGHAHGSAQEARP